MAVRRKKAKKKARKAPKKPSKLYVDRYDHGLVVLDYTEGGTSLGVLKLDLSGAVKVGRYPIARIKWIDVKGDRRGEGIATKLYKKAAQLAWRRGMALSSDTQLRKGSKGFWEKQVRLKNAVKLGRRYVLCCPPPRRLNPGSREPDQRLVLLREYLAETGDLEGFRRRLGEVG